MCVYIFIHLSLLLLHTVNNYISIITAYYLSRCILFFDIALISYLVINLESAHFLLLIAISFTFEVTQLITFDAVDC